MVGKIRKFVIGDGCRENDYVKDRTISTTSKRSFMGKERNNCTWSITTTSHCEASGSFQIKWISREQMMFPSDDDSSQQRAKDTSDTQGSDVRKMNSRIGFLTACSGSSSSSGCGSGGRCTGGCSSGGGPGRDTSDKEGSIRQVRH